MSFRARKHEQRHFPMSYCIDVRRFGSSALLPLVDVHKCVPAMCGSLGTWTQTTKTRTEKL